MITGTSSLSIKKQDLQSQKTPSTGYTKTQFAHKATAGQTGISLSALTIPTEMSSNGFSNPSSAQLQSANLLFFKNNLTLVSSARGHLQQGLSYVVASSTQINFVGFAALEGEIFTGVIDYTAVTGSTVVDASPAIATGTLAASTTDFNAGTPFKVAQFITTQIGAVIVYLDGQQMFRNTSNSSTVLDGDYYEVDAGNGLGSIIRFNVSDPSPRSVCVISNGLLYEKPSGSTQAALESIQGQVNNMATYVADAVGQPLTTVLGGQPTQQDLKAFGDRVLAVEQNRARIDVTNTFTAHQLIPGRTDGTAIAAGYIGEVSQSKFSTASASGVTAGQYGNLSSIPTTAGVWLICGSVSNTRVSGQTYFRAAISENSSNTTTDHTDGYNQLQTDIQWDHTDKGTLTFSGVIANNSTSKTYYIKGLQDGGTWTQANWQGHITAIRIA